MATSTQALRVAPARTARRARGSSNRIFTPLITRTGDAPDRVPCHYAPGRADALEEMGIVERVLDIRFTRYGTILEELEIICCMTGFRRWVLVEYTADGSRRSVELGAG